MPLTVRPFEVSDLDRVVALVIRAWEPVHASMAMVLGDSVGQRVYPDWVASQTENVRRASTHPDVST